MLSACCLLPAGQTELHLFSDVVATKYSKCAQGVQHVRSVSDGTRCGLCQTALGAPSADCFLYIVH
jgi:hypothetical protein